MSKDEFRRGYRVELGGYAELEFDQVTARIAASSTQAATDWIAGFFQLIDDIGDFNINFGYAIENGDSSRELRQVMHHSHRIVYTIDEALRVVQIVHIRHHARDRIPPSELP